MRWCRGHGEVLQIGLFPLAWSLCLLIEQLAQSGTISNGLNPPQSICKKITYRFSDRMILLRHLPNWGPRPPWWLQVVDIKPFGIVNWRKQSAAHQTPVYMARNFFSAKEIVRMVETFVYRLLSIINIWKLSLFISDPWHLHIFFSFH